MMPCIVLGSRWSCFACFLGLDWTALDFVSGASLFRGSNPFLCLPLPRYATQEQGQDGFAEDTVLSMLGV